MSTLKINKDLENLIKKIVLDTYYPVGSLYLSVNKTNPSSIFGGTWELVGSGSYLMCYDPSNAWFDKPDASVGSNGSSGNWRSEDTVLTINQIPSHNHGQSTIKGTFETRAMNNTDDNPILNANGICSVRREVWSGSHDAFAKTNASNKKTNYVDINATHTHSANGGGKGHSHFHVSPYYVVCVWKRTK